MTDLSVRKRALVIGGTGLIGYHVVKSLSTNYIITILSLPEKSNKNLFTDNINIIYNDFNRLTNKEILTILEDKDLVIFAAGADDRYLPEKPAYEYFYKYNVESSVRLIELCSETDVNKVLIFGSFFTYLDRIWPEMKLALDHPYIRSRKEQIKQCYIAKRSDLKLVFIELPFVFGRVPGRKSLWKPLMKYLRFSLPIFYMEGGTNIISASIVGNVVKEVIEDGREGVITLGGENITWKNLFLKISEVIKKDKISIKIPVILVRWIALIIKLIHIISGKESGLDPQRSISLLSRKMYIQGGRTDVIIISTKDKIYKALSETF